MNDLWTPRGYRSSPDAEAAVKGPKRLTSFEKIAKYIKSAFPGLLHNSRRHITILFFSSRCHSCDHSRTESMLLLLWCFTCLSCDKKKVQAASQPGRQPTSQPASQPAILVHPANQTASPASQLASQSAQPPKQSASHPASQ